MKSKISPIPKQKYHVFLSYSKQLPWNEMIQKLREYSECTQQQVATAINVNRKTYSNYESGVSDIGIEKIKKLAQLYGIPSSIILGEPDLMSEFMKEIAND